MGRGGTKREAELRARIARLREPVEHDHSIYLDQDYLAAARAEMSFTPSERVLIAGDVHGDLRAVDLLARRARANGASVILQLGDLGYWPHTDPQFIRKADRLLEQEGVHMLAIDGNHENFSALSCEHPDYEQFRVLGRRVLHIPRGARFEWRGRSFAALGGAHSIDKDWRRARERQARKRHQNQNWLWWPQELVSDDDVEQTTAGGRAEILLTHDCPMSVRIPGFDRPDPTTTENRDRLQRVMDAVRPQLVCHGHYHRRYTGVGGGFDWAARVEGLDCNGSGDDSFFVLDLSAPIPGPDDRS